MEEKGSVSRLELLQFLGVIPFTIGFFLAIYILIGRLLLWVVPTTGQKFAESLAGLGIDIGNRLFEAVLVVGVLIFFGGGLAVFAGYWARRNERLLRERLGLLRKSLERYRAERGEAPRALDELVRLGYLKRIPTDPMRWPSKVWDEVQSSPEQGITDVRTLARSCALDGSSYDSW